MACCVTLTKIALCPMPSIELLSRRIDSAWHGLIEAIGTQLDGMFNPAKINARQAVCLQGHIWHYHTCFYSSSVGLPEKADCSEGPIAF
jgi:hypothetical protein